MASNNDAFSRLFDLENWFCRKRFTYSAWKFYTFIGIDSDLDLHKGEILNKFGFVFDFLESNRMTIYLCEMRYSGDTLRLFMPHPLSLINLNAELKGTYIDWLRRIGQSHLSKGDRERLERDIETL
jgi:hypothetical protein